MTGDDLDKALDLLVSARSTDAIFEHRFLVHEVLQALLEEGYRSSERAALARGRPFVVLEPGGGDPYEVIVSRASTAPVSIEGSMVIRRGLRGLTGGGLPVHLPGPEKGEKEREVELQLAAPWNRNAVLSEPVRAILMVRPDEPPRIELAQSPPSLATLMFGLPLEVLEFTPADARWRPKGWRPLDGLQPNLTGTPEEDERVSGQLVEMADQFRAHAARSGDARLVSLAEALQDAGDALRTVGRELSAPARAVDRAHRFLRMASKDYPEGAVVAPASSEGTMPFTGIADRERGALAQIFPTPTGETALALSGAAVRFGDLLTGATWRTDTVTVASAQEGHRVPLILGEGPEDYVVEARIEGDASEVTLGGWAVEPAAGRDRVMMLSFKEPAGMRAHTLLEICSTVANRESVARVHLDASETPSWHNHVWGVRAVRSAEARLTLRARSTDGMSQPRPILGLLMRRLSAPHTLA